MRPNAWPQLEFTPVTEAEHGLTSRVISRYPSSEAIIHIPSVATLTTVAGGTSNPDYIEVSELKDWFLDAKEGNDEVVVTETSTGFELYGAAGIDTLTAMGDVSDALIKGGAATDEITIEGASSNSSVYGGKAADTISFERAVVGGVVSGDTSTDKISFTEKVSGGAVIDGGADDDTIEFGGRITNVTVQGGAARDSIVVSESLDSLVDGGVDNDKLDFSGGHSNLIAKGGEGADTLVLEGTVSGTGNRFYGGKDNDSIEIQTGAAVAVHGDNEDDKITLSAVKSAASVFGGAGIDTLNLSAALADSTLTAKGNAGNDDIDGSNAEADETIYGGQGDDNISGTGNGSRSYYGDKGDDVIFIGSNEASMASGGEGADTIRFDTVVTAADEKFHTVSGGAGIDSISVEGAVIATWDPETIDDTKNITSLQYASAAEFFTAGDVVDEILIDNGTFVKADVAEALTFIDIDSFDRVQMSAGADGKRDVLLEGLVIATTDAATSGSSIVFSKDVDDYLAGVDLSASAATAGSLIDNSAGNGLGMILKGTEGDNTIKGGSGADYIVGGSGADTLTGGDGADSIDAGTEGTDTVDGGAGDDYIDLGTDMSKTDLISGGDGDDTLAFNHKSGSTDILDRVSAVEAIKLENTSTDASITLVDTTIAAGDTLTVTTTSTQTFKLTFNASAEKDGKLNVTGAAGADTITGGDLDDTIAGGKGADSLTGGSGADTFVLQTTQALNGTDIITDFSVANVDVLDLAFGAPGVPANVDLRGTGVNAERLAAAAALGANTGLVISSADVADAAAAELYMEGLTGEAADDIVYLIASTDADSATGNVSLYSATYTGAGDATITTLATLGQEEADNITNAQLADFTL
ncbi:cell surface protein required for swimming motility [Synechococcus sp. A18-40]|nr:cell surface protein required for swimming motility [Synechococcus sp. A18-40]